MTDIGLTIIIGTGIWTVITGVLIYKTYTITQSIGVIHDRIEDKVTKEL